MPSPKPTQVLFAWGRRKKGVSTVNVNFDAIREQKEREKPAQVKEGE